MNEINIITRISKDKQKKQFYELFNKVLYELNMNNIYNNYFVDKKLLSEEYFQKINDLKKIKINEINKMQ